jgi:type I restriction enzyme, S subunit
MSELPKGWCHGPLRDITSKIGSGATPTGGKTSYKTGGIPLIRSMNVHFSGFTASGLAYIDDEQAKKHDGVVVQAGDVLLNITGASIGRVTTAPLDMEGARVNQHVAIVRTADGIENRFVAGFLSSPYMQRIIAEENYGVTRQALTKSMIEEFSVPLPPQLEQRRIVAKIDGLSAKSKRARDHLDHIPRLVEKYKQAILAAAFRGELTQGQSQKNRQSALQRLQEVRSERQSAELPARRRTALSKLATPSSELGRLPQLWTWVSIEELAADDDRSIQSGPFGSTLLHSEFQNAGYLVIGIDNVQNGAFSPGSQNRISEAKFRELERFRARPEDVLITVMATVGRTCVLPEEIEPSIITKHVYRISVDRRLMLPRYLMNALRGSEAVLEQMGANIRGQPRPGLNGEIIKKIFVPLAPEDEQHEIVRRIESAFAWIDRLASQAASARTLIGHLDQAILAKAFRGELVQQDPADEPAGVLLDRIRTVRSAQAPAHGRRSRP